MHSKEIKFMCGYNAQENGSLQFPFTHLKLRRESKEDYVKVGENKTWKSSLLDCRIVNKMRGCLKRRFLLVFQRCINLGAQKQWAGIRQ